MESSQKHIISITLCLIVVIAVTISYFNWQITNEQKNLVIHHYQDRLKIFKQALGDSLIDRISVIEELLSFGINTKFSETDIDGDGIYGIPESAESVQRHQLQLLLQNNHKFESVGLFLPNGDIYLAEPFSSQINLPQKNYAFRDWYNGAINYDGVYVSEPYETHYTNEKTIALSSSIYDGEALVGIFHTTMQLDSLRRLVGVQGEEKDEEWCLIDHNGKIAFCKENTFDEKFFSELIPTLGNNPYFFSKFFGTEYMIIHEILEIQNKNWHLLFIQPTANSFSTVVSADSLTESLLIASITIISGFGGVLFWYNSKSIKVRKQLEENLHELDNFKMAQDASAIVSITNVKGDITYVNDKFSEITKYSSDELIGENHRILNSGHHPHEFFEKMWKTISDGKIWHSQIRDKAKDGSYFWVDTTITPLVGRDGKPQRYIAMRYEITNQKRLENELQNNIKRLKKSDIQKEEFSSMITHELKTPLVPILGHTKMLSKENMIGKLNEEQRESVEIIERNTKRLERLINDIMDARKLDLGVMKFDEKDISLEEFMNSLKSNYQEVMDEKKIEFIVNNELKDTHIKTDESRLHQVLDNLISNSIKFVRETDAKITVGVSRDNKFVKFFVRDNGIGVPIDEQEKLFQKFYQVDTSHIRKAQGTGLGLAISKGIVEHMGGKIWLISDGKTGTTFSFTIPINDKTKK